jgi:hypothetical protein
MEERQNSHNHLNRCRKSLRHNPTALNDKSPEKKKKLGIEATHINPIKPRYDITSANIVLNGRNEKLSLTIRKETRVSTLSTHIYYRAETPKQTNKERESNESDTSGKGSNQNIPI